MQERTQVGRRWRTCKAEGMMWGDRRLYLDPSLSKCSSSWLMRNQPFQHLGRAVQAGGRACIETLGQERAGIFQDLVESGGGSSWQERWAGETVDSPAFRGHGTVFKFAIRLMGKLWKVLRFLSGKQCDLIIKMTLAPGWNMDSGGVQLVCSGRPRDDVGTV